MPGQQVNTYNSYQGIEAGVPAADLFKTVLEPLSYTNLYATDLLEAPAVDAVFNTSDNKSISGVNLHYMYGSVMKEVQESTCSWVSHVIYELIPAWVCILYYFAVQFHPVKCTLHATDGSYIHKLFFVCDRHKVFMVINVCTGVHS